MLDLGLRSRAIFAAAWVAVQGALILTGSRRADRAFAFRMFPESSTITISLSRGVAGPSGQLAFERMDGGRWKALDAAGEQHDFAWTDRVKDPVLSNVDVTVMASYGAEAQLSRLAAALDDVAAHTDADRTTAVFAADVVVTHNGHEPYAVHLESRRRP